MPASCAMVEPILFLLAAPDPRLAVMEAMGQELSRATERLRLDGYERPYFIGYQVRDVTAHEVSGRYGAVMDDLLDPRDRALELVSRSLGANPQSTAALLLKAALLLWRFRRGRWKTPRPSCWFTFTKRASANPRMAPIYVRREDFRSTMILGVVVGVFRKVSARS